MSATLQTMRSGGSQHPEEIMNFHTSRVVKGTGGIFDKDAGGLLVEEEAVPAMSVLVNEGYAFLRKSGDDMVYPVRLYDGDDSVAISSNSSGSTRIDAIVLYVDLGASANADITNVAKLVVVEGTPAGSPTAPTDGDIETAIGASNPYLRLADVTVENGETAILDADITDQRDEVLFISNGTPVADGDVANKKYVDDSLNIDAKTAKTAPVGADEVLIEDSEDSFAKKKLTLANLLKVAYPVGSIYINASVDTNPATLLGFGTWTAFGAGRVPVGQDTGDTDFDTLEETGGAKTHTLTAAQSGLPAHAHSLTSQVLARGASGTGSNNTATTTGDRSVEVADALANTAQNASSAHNNLQPYIVVKMWKRTA